MNKVMMALVLVFGVSAFAEGGSSVTPANTPAVAGAVKKADKRTARKECLKENSKLKGADLHKCIDSKTM